MNMIRQLCNFKAEIVAFMKTIDKCESPPPPRNESDNGEQSSACATVKTNLSCSINTVLCQQGVQMNA